MTTPNRPPFPEWYQKDRRIPSHVGPTQRELIARRIRSLRRLLVSVSFIGIATFTSLAAYHSQSTASAASAQTTTAIVQQGTAINLAPTSTATTFSQTASLSAPSTTTNSSSQSSSSFRTKTASS